MTTLFRKTSLAIASAAAAATLVLATLPAAAQDYQPPALPGAQRRPELRQRLRQLKLTVGGRVTAINGADLVLDTPARPGRRGNPQQNAGELIVQTSASTQFYTPASNAAKLGDIKVGDRVAVLIVPPTGAPTGAPAGAPTAARTVVAQAVTVLPVPEQATVRGEVSNPSANGFTLSAPRGGRSGTVTAAPGAKVVIAGNAGATLVDIKSGDKVAVHGQPDGNGAIAADVIVVRPSSRDNVAGGVLASISGNTLVIFTQDGRQLKVDAAGALVFDHGDAAASLSDLRVGRPVGVLGVKNADGSMKAQLVAQANLLP